MTRNCVIIGKSFIYVAKATIALLVFLSSAKADGNG